MRLFPNKSLLNAGLVSLLIKTGNVVINVMLVALLARVLGASGYGQYAFVYSVITILAIPVQVGLPQLIVRETSQALLHGDVWRMRIVWRWSHIVVVCTASVFLLLGYLALWGYRDVSFSTEGFIAGLLLLPLIALGRLRGAALRGLGHVILGQVPDSVLRPSFLFILVVVVVLVGKSDVDVALVMGLHVAAAGIAFLIGFFFLVKYAPRMESQRPEKNVMPLTKKGMLMAAGTIGVASGLQVINTNFDIVALGLMRSQEEVGVYKVVATAAGLVAFGLHAMNAVTSPRISRLYAKGNIEELQILVVNSAQIVLILALTLCVFLVLFGEWVLGLAFGDIFRSGYSALIILMIGQLANAFFGSVVPLLNMSGHEKDTLVGGCIAVSVNVGLNLLLIPSYGILGAASATTISAVVWNLILWRYVKIRLGVNSTVFGARV